jgi:hypothetical protein
MFSGKPVNHKVVKLRPEPFRIPGRKEKQET